MGLGLGLSLTLPRGRAAAWTPAALRPELQGGWWTKGVLNFSDAGGTTPSVVGGVVSHIKSRFPTVFNLNEAVGSYPTLAANGFTFGGTQGLRGLKPGGGFYESPLSLYAVGTFTGASGGNATLIDGWEQNEARVFSADPATSALGWAGGSIGSHIGPFLNVVTTFRIKVKTGTTQCVFSVINTGGLQSRAATRNSSLSGVAIGGNTFDDQRLIGYVKDVVLLIGDVTDEEHSLVQEYFRATWGHY